MRYKLTDQLTFGKHKNKTIQEVIDTSPTYFEWALFEIEGFELDDEAMDKYEEALEDHYREEESYYPSPHYSDW